MGFLSRATAVVLLAAVGAEAMFGGKNSDVEELTAKTLPKFLNTHKPVMLLLYAPWCGHCKAIHGDWEKLAGSLKGIVKVGAVDASTHKEVAQQYSVQGFPTIKTFSMNPPGKGKGKRVPMDYQQERKFGAMKTAALGLINQKYVNNLPADYEAVKESAHVVLFTKKDKTPPMFSVVAASPKLSHFTFYKVQEGKKGAKNFDNVPSWPAVGVFTPGEEPRWLPLSEGKAKYETIATFVLGSGTGSADAGSADAGSAGDAAEGAEETEKKPKGPSMTSGTLELSSATLGRCQKGVLCVFHNGPRENVVNLREKKVLFFTSTPELLAKLASALTLSVPEGSTLVMRPTNAEGTTAKYLVSDKDVREVVGAAVNGDVPLKKLDLDDKTLAKLLG